MCLRLITIVRFIKMLYRHVEHFHSELTIDARFHKPRFSVICPPQQEFSSYKLVTRQSNLAESNLHFMKKSRLTVRNWKSYWHILLRHFFMTTLYTCSFCNIQKSIMIYACEFTHSCSLQGSNLGSLNLQSILLENKLTHNQRIVKLIT